MKAGTSYQEGIKEHTQARASLRSEREMNLASRMHEVKLMAERGWELAGRTGKGVPNRYRKGSFGICAAVKGYWRAFQYTGRYWKCTPYGRDIEILARIDLAAFKTPLAMAIWFDTCIPNGVPVWGSKP